MSYQAGHKFFICYTSALVTHSARPALTYLTVILKQNWRNQLAGLGVDYSWISSLHVEHLEKDWSSYPVSHSLLTTLSFILDSFFLPYPYTCCPCRGPQIQ